MVFNLAQGQEEKRNIRSDKRERERERDTLMGDQHCSTGQKTQQRRKVRKENKVKLQRSNHMVNVRHL
jgi:hypothetical protein